MSPFEQILGDRFAELPEPVRRIHSLISPLATAGRSDITAATNIFATVIAWGAGLPRAGSNVDVTVHFTPQPAGREQWRRKFGARRYASTLEAGRGADEGYLVEHFGPFDLKFRLSLQDRSLRWSLAGWRLFGIPLPRRLAPRIECVESADGDRFTFDIDVAFPIVGWLMHYRGYLEKQP